MSHRHQDSDTPRLAHAEQRAHAHSERHRIKGELHVIVKSVGQSLDADDCDEPAIGWKPAHHHDPAHADAKTEKQRVTRHWKLKEWKRRTTNRRKRADIQRHFTDDL